MAKTLKAKPPVEHRFKPGQSGNPSGRPKGSGGKQIKMRTPALHETVKFTIDGKVQRPSRRDIIIQHARKLTVSGGSRKLRSALLKLDAQLGTAQPNDSPSKPQTRVIAEVRSNHVFNVENMMQALDLGYLVYRDKPAMRVVIEPALVTLALQHIAPNALSRDEQMQVLAFTRTPKKVLWPDWWEPDLRGTKKRLPKRLR